MENEMRRLIDQVKNFGKKSEIFENKINEQDCWDGYKKGKPAL